VLVRDAGWFGPSLAGVTGLALLLRARHFRGRTQRLWLLCGGVACIALVALRLTFDERSGLMLLAVGVPCVVVAATLGAWAVSMTERRLSPYWGRATDLLEVFVLLAVVPLTLGVLGVYSAILDRFG
jgi:hypothetical protein